MVILEGAGESNLAAGGRPPTPTPVPIAPMGPAAGAGCALKRGVGMEEEDDEPNNMALRRRIER